MRPGNWYGRPARWSSRCWPTTSSVTACAMLPTLMKADPMPTRPASAPALAPPPAPAAADDDVVLSVEHLSLDFRLRTEVLHAARDVSFKLRRGKTLCLVGESGSGKSV